jgi:hypothetical protein
MIDEVDLAVKVEHGVDFAGYSRVDWPDGGHTVFRPHFRCLCGWGTPIGDRQPENWEEAGRLFDAHMTSAHTANS